MPDTTYLMRANVAGILQRPTDGKILICERVNNPGAWQFPQGGVDKGETLLEAMQRELKEEISVRKRHVRIRTQRGPYAYLFGGGEKKKGHHGKLQYYFLADFLGTDADIILETEHPEFRAFRWIAPAEFSASWLPEMKLEVYRAVFRDFFQIELRA